MGQTRISAVLALVTVACLGCGPGESTVGAPPGSAQSEESPAPQPVTAPAWADDALVLGPRGVGPLRLGMTEQEVVDTGAARAPLGSRHDGWPEGCRVLEYQPDHLGRVPDDTVNGALSADQGLERLSATRRMVTPEGIRLGSPIDEVREAYDRPEARPGTAITVAASRDAVYRLQLGKAVVSISLELRRLDCTI